MTQCNRLENWLNEHGEIDPLTAWTELGIYRLGARLFDLRKKGLEIETQKKTVLNRFGEKCTVANYKLIKK